MGIHACSYLIRLFQSLLFAHRNYRPTDSDLEDEEDEEDEDPAVWLQEEENETLINPNLVDPDIPDEMTPEELSHILCIDRSRIDYG